MAKPPFQIIKKSIPETFHSAFPPLDKVVSSFACPYHIIPVGSKSVDFRGTILSIKAVFHPVFLSSQISAAIQADFFPKQVVEFRDKYFNFINLRQALLNKKPRRSRGYFICG